MVLPQRSREVLEDLRLGRLSLSTNDAKLPTAWADASSAPWWSALTIAAVLARGAGEPRLGIGLLAATLVLGLHVLLSLWNKP